jgi:hypothetical protein
VQRDNPQREVEQIAAEPEAVPHVPEVQLPEPEINLPPNAPAHTNTIGVQADNNVINGEDFISENTPLTINNDPLVVPYCLVAPDPVCSQWIMLLTSLSPYTPTSRHLMTVLFVSSILRISFTTEYPTRKHSFLKVC